jgi:hypothetical protein
MNQVLTHNFYEEDIQAFFKFHDKKPTDYCIEWRIQLLTTNVMY